MIFESSFKAAWWLSNPHIQTIYSSLRNSRGPKVDGIEHLELPDGDYLDLAWNRADLPVDAPLVIILHGLGGGIQSAYVPRFMEVFKQKGWRSVLMHFRGAGQEVNRLDRAYHSGDTADLDFFMQVLAQREPHTKKAIVGVSLGGNVLLKWLGEQGAKASVDTAVAISVPFMLREVADKMNRGFSRVYQRHLLKQLKVFFARKAQGLNNPSKVIEQAAACTCFWTFDHQVTAPLHGFNCAHDYYHKSSSKQYLKHIKKPVLIIHSLDDPFMSPKVLPSEEELSDSILLELSAKGGHVGFISCDRAGRPYYWLDKRIPEYLGSVFTTLESSLK